MGTTRHPTADDRSEVIHLVLAGLSRGVDLSELVTLLHHLHSRYHIFPGDLLLELGADALDASGATRAAPIDYAEIRERYLPEREFRRRVEHYKNHYALTAAAMIRAGVQPDIAGEAVWWNADDLWMYALYALVIYVRAAAEHTGASPADICACIAARHQMHLDDAAR